MDIDAALLQSVRATWPGVDVPEDALLAFVSARSSIRLSDRHPRPEREAALSDLYIACACSQANPAAIRALEDRYASVLDSVRRRFGPRAPTLDELRSDLAARLFVGGEREAPRIALYSGEVPLGAWLKVVATRIVLNRLAAGKSEEAYDERVLDGLLWTHDTPERSVVRAEARATFQKALGRAVRELRARDRQLLRLAFADGLTIDDLAALYNVHRTTTFRWVREASARLAEGMRRIVREELGLSAVEYERWWKELESGLEVSVTRYLEATGE